MKSGYTRVRSWEYPLDVQIKALTKAGCGTAFIETASGATAQRPVDDVGGQVGLSSPGEDWSG